VIVRALSILASEVGLSEADMPDDMVFADYGVDSLLSLTVTGRYREELNLDLESSVFIDQPTIRDFKRFVIQMSPSESSDGSASEPDTEISFNGNVSSGASSPASAGTISPPNEKMMMPVQEDNTMKGIRAILADEIGVPAEEIKVDENLSEMGMDSLLSLTVLGKIRESLDLDLPGEFFVENQTIAQIETALGLKPKAAPPPLASPETVPANKLSTQSVTSGGHPKATSILLQGNPRTATKTLFLFPDGSGSATSYATIPGVSPDVCVYGLNCPYMKTPEKLNCSLDELTTPYLAEIRRRQPKGPYSFGGWSAGGICAYDAARTLILQENEEVDRLLLLDSPFPIGLEKLPTRLYDFFDKIGLFGEGKAAPPAWLLPHFLAFIDSLDAYKAVPLPFNESQWEKKMPKTYLIWAKDGVCPNPSDPWPEPAPDGSKDPKEMVWLLNNRTDLGPNKWDSLVGSQNIGGITVLQGANHFTMTRGEKAKELAAFMADALGA
jgi:naphtho-gamma-pyrone polyketide synthase